MSPEFKQACEELYAELEARAVEASAMSANQDSERDPWMFQAMALMPAVGALRHMLTQDPPEGELISSAALRNFALRHQPDIMAAMERHDTGRSDA